MDASASASAAATARISKADRLHFGNLSSHGRYPADERARRTSGPLSSSAGAGRPIPSKRESFGPAQDDEKTGHLAAALTELGYSVEFAPDGDAKLATILTNRPNVILCVCSTARGGDLGLFERNPEASSQTRALPPVLVIGQRDSEYAGARVRVDDRVSGSARLTVREKDVLTWAARGKTSAEIAIILGLSERTINFHCDKAMRRLDVINRTQAVAKAIAAGLIGI
jgi:DNA-binding CsgD family transcriptional regulator